MARERKPLIEPGSVLPGSDMLSRIVERDRRGAGRREPVAAGDEEAQIATTDPPLFSATPSDGAVSNITGNTVSPVLTPEAELPPSVPPQKLVRPATPARQAAPPALSREPDVRQKAQELAESRLMPITLRLPEALNDWLDDYAHAHRKEGLKKQDLVSRAVQLLYIESMATEN